MSAVAAPRLALSGHDLYLFREGTHSRLYQKLGQIDREKELRQMMGRFGYAT